MVSILSYPLDLVIFPMGMPSLSVKMEALTIVPSLILALFSIYLSFFSLVTSDPATKKLTIFLSLSLFLGAVVFGIFWFAYWISSKKLSHLET
ncbi:MAG: hypothetical protein PVF15_03435 [Candidatus Bathyarchaeota archaeon]|jgi:hypothetical protein